MKHSGACLDYEAAGLENLAASAHSAGKIIWSAYSVWEHTVAT